LIYEFTLRSIESSLLAARGRGVEVKLVVDRSESKTSSSLYPELQQKGFDVAQELNRSHNLQNQLKSLKR
jgi:uncharacterized protein (DUF302 family)